MAAHFQARDTGLLPSIWQLHCQFHRGLLMAMLNVVWHPLQPRRSGASSDGRTPVTLGRLSSTVTDLTREFRHTICHQSLSCLPRMVTFSTPHKASSWEDARNGWMKDMEGNPHQSRSLRLKFIVSEVMIVSLAKSTPQIDLGTIQGHRQTSSGA